MVTAPSVYLQPGHFPAFQIQPPPVYATSAITCVMGISDFAWPKVAPGLTQTNITSHMAPCIGPSLVPPHPTPAMIYCQQFPK